MTSPIRKKVLSNTKMLKGKKLPAGQAFYALPAQPEVLQSKQQNNTMLLFCGKKVQNCLPDAARAEVKFKDNRVHMGQAPLTENLMPPSPVSIFTLTRMNRGSWMRCDSPFPMNSKNKTLFSRDTQ